MTYAQSTLSYMASISVFVFLQCIYPNVVKNSIEEHKTEVVFTCLLHHVTQYEDDIYLHHFLCI